MAMQGLFSKKDANMSAEEVGKALCDVLEELSNHNERLVGAPPTQNKYSEHVLFVHHLFLFVTIYGSVIFCLSLSISLNFLQKTIFSVLKLKEVFMLKLTVITIQYVGKEYV